MIIPKLSQPENSEPIGGYRFLDRVKVKVGSRLIMAVGQQAAMFFDGHEGLIIGQNKDLEYHVYFDKAKDFGYPDKVIDVFSTQNLVFLGSNVESTQTAYKPDVGDGLPLITSMKDLGRRLSNPDMTIPPRFSEIHPDAAIDAV